MRGRLVCWLTAVSMRISQLLLAMPCQLARNLDEEATTTNNRCTAATAANSGSPACRDAHPRPKTGRRSVDDRDSVLETAGGALLAELGTTDGGLTSQEAALRLLRYGSNDAAAPKRAPAWLRFIRLLANPLVIILLVASALSAATGDVASFVIIASIVLLSVLLDFAQESQAQNAVDALRQQVALRADVRRDGAEASLPVDQLVPGDIVRLTAGDLVPADGVLLSSRDFFVNQALLTGESFPVEKHAAEHGDPATEISEAGNVALAGTSVISGSAVQLICQTGRRTTLGQLADTLIAKPPPTSFEIGLRRFSMLILRITLVLVVLVMAESMAFHRPWIDALIFALALAVGLTPELLPMIMTITLARGAVRLSHQRVIVKSLPAIHNLGAMDVLCTDKTGTLTEARIALTRHVDIAGNDSERVLTLAWLNSHFESGLKSPLDDAILAHGTIDPSPWRKIDEVPFDFERRRVSVLVERDGARTLILKGAPEDVIRICTSVEMPDGTSRTLTDELRAEVQALFRSIKRPGLPAARHRQPRGAAGSGKGRARRREGTDLCRLRSVSRPAQGVRRRGACRRSPRPAWR